MKISGRRVSGKAQVIKAIRDHFQTHFKQPQVPEITLPLGSFRSIDPDMALKINEIPSSQEIVVGLRSCDPRKALGYDDFNIGFVINNWEILGEKVIKFVQDFFINGSFPTSINTTWITMIPKCQPPISIEDF